MKIESKKLIHQANEYGYYDLDYRFCEDPDLTYQEYVIMSVLHAGGFRDEYLDFDEIISLKIGSFVLNNFEESYKDGCIGSKTHPVIIDKLWDKVLVNKKKANK